MLSMLKIRSELQLKIFLNSSIYRGLILARHGKILRPSIGSIIYVSTENGLSMHSEYYSDDNGPLSEVFVSGFYDLLSRKGEWEI